jgi:hypothetical protein
MIDLTDGLKLSLWVQGHPRTKGSLKCMGKRGKIKHLLVEDHPLSAPWRTRMNNAIVREVRAAYPGRWTPYAGPVLVDAVFYFERIGPTALVSPWPTINSGVNANGDEDKLRRNVLDALEGSGLISDDCNVIGNVTAGPRKRWAAPGLPAGVQIEVVSL